MTAQPFPLRNESGTACPQTAEPVTRGSVASIHRTAGSKARPTVGLTQRQRDLFIFITAYQREHGGISPSFAEMRAGLGLAGADAIFRLLTALEERGYIRRLRYRNRAIEVLQAAPGPQPLRFIPIGTREPGDEPSTAYRGPFPIRSHRTCAEWMDA